MILEMLTEDIVSNPITLKDELVEEYRKLVINPNKIDGYFYPNQYDEFITINIWFNGVLFTVKETPELTMYLRNNLDNKYEIK